MTSTTQITNVAALLDLTVRHATVQASCDSTRHGAAGSPTTSGPKRKRTTYTPRSPWHNGYSLLLTLRSPGSRNAPQQLRRRRASSGTTRSC